MESDVMVTFFTEWGWWLRGYVMAPECSTPVVSEAIEFTVAENK
jgi:hypothetical protein